MLKTRVARNLAANRALPCRGLIFDQNAAPVKDMRFGRFCSGYNGCGWIAVHNLLQLTGRGKDPAEVAADLERHRGAVLGGLFGIWPGAVARALKREGYAVTVCRRVKRFDEAVPEGGVFILWYAHRRGMHYVAGRREKEGFVGYNVFRGDRGPEPLGPSLRGFLQRYRYRGLRLYVAEREKV